MSCHSRSIAINAAIVIDNEIFFNILCYKWVILVFLYSTSLRVIMKLSTSPFSLQMRCSLNPKNQPIEHFPKSRNKNSNTISM